MTWTAAQWTGSVRSSHQTVSHYTLRQWFPNTQQSRFLTACRRLKNYFYLPFLTQIFHSWWCETCTSYITTVLNETMWHYYRESKHTLTPPTCFQGVQIQNPNNLPRIYAPGGRDEPVSPLTLPPPLCSPGGVAARFSDRQVSATGSSVVSSSSPTSSFLLALLARMMIECRSGFGKGRLSLPECKIDRPTISLLIVFWVQKVRIRRGSNSEFIPSYGHELGLQILSFLNATRLR